MGKQRMNKRWQTHEGPAIRVCVERWIQEQTQDLPLTELPLEVVRNGSNSTETFLREMASSREVMCRSKICVVGPTFWGKTSLVKSLTSKKPSLVHPDNRTIGIDHFDLIIEEHLHGLKAIKKHVVTFWDFAGQDAYQSAHSLFYSARTVYVVCIDLESYVLARMQAELMTDTESEATRWLNEFVDTRILRYIRVICACQTDAEFVFVATKRDRVFDSCLESDDGMLANLRQRMANVAVIIQEMKKEARENGRDEEGDCKEWVDDPTQPLPTTHLGDPRLAKTAEKPSVRIIVTSCMTSKDVDAFTREMESEIIKHGRGFPMPDKFSLVLKTLLQMRADAMALETDKQIVRTVCDVDEVIQQLVENVKRPVMVSNNSDANEGVGGPWLQTQAQHQLDSESKSSDKKREITKIDVEEEPYVDELTCRVILYMLHDLGDVLWYGTIDDELLRNTVILNPMLMIDVVRDIFDHNHTGEVTTHHSLKSLKHWRHLEGTESMLSMKRLFAKFLPGVSDDG